MNRILTALCWASAILLLAAANAAGLVADESAKVLFTVLPVIAWMSISGSGSCEGLTRWLARKPTLRSGR